MLLYGPVLAAVQYVRGRMEAARIHSDSVKVHQGSLKLTSARTSTNAFPAWVEMEYALAETLYRVLVGMTMAVVVGLPLGILMGRFKSVENFVLPLASALMPNDVASRRPATRERMRSST